MPDPSSALLLSTLLAQRNAAPAAPAVPPGPVFMGPNPYAVPPPYLNPNTTMPTAAPAVPAAPAGTPDATAALLQQLLATPAPTAAPSAFGSPYLLAGGAACLVCAVIVAVVVARRGRSAASAGA